MRNTKTDVLIIGGGIAGITAALELIKLGRKVHLIDRDKKENFGGLAKESFGGMFFVDTPQQRKAGMKDSPELALSDWISTAEFEPDDHLPKEWAKQYVYHCTSQVYEWLRQNKIGFFPVVHWVERGMFKPGNSFPRFHMVWGTGYELIRVLINHLINHPGSKDNLTCSFGYNVKELLQEGEQIKGARGVVEGSDETFEIVAEASIVAAGGIGGNIEKVKKYWYKPWGSPPKTILNGAHPYGDGRLHEDIEKKNGRITHLDWMWPYAAGVHHPRPKIPDHGLSLVPPKSALWVNSKGERIGPIPLVGSFDTKFLVEQICKQEKKYSWQILNLKIACKELAISGSEFNTAIKEKSYYKFIKSVLLGNKQLVDDMLDHCIDFVTGNSLDELTQKMNQLTATNEIDPSLLHTAIQKYDREIDKGPKYFNDEQLRRIAHARTYRGDRVRTCKFQKIDDKKAYPLIAIREHILSRKTLGGIQTDLYSRILDMQGNPIKGAYAVGEAAGFGGGGMHGKAALEGTFLGSCILTARIAAYHISDKKLINP